jgi:mRNA interferase MazF
MNPKRGDVVDVLFPFSDLNQVKLRPALIVQADALFANSDVVVACITGNLVRTGPARVLIRLADVDGPATNLKTDSVILADKLATIDRKAIRSVRGIFRRMDLVDTALRFALGL